MTKQIPSKVTTYNGIQYRSRLEARWAVFFTSIGIQFSYETIVFQRADTEVTYTPDFVLPTNRRGYNIYVEVKPIKPTNEYMDFLKTLLQTRDWKSLVVTIGDFYKGNVPRVWFPSINANSNLENWGIKTLGISPKKFKQHRYIAETYRFDI